MADDAAALWAQLRQGGVVALVRHTEAPGDPGDPAGFRLDDCSTQRNLSPKGRDDARRLGEQFRAHGVPVGKVLSSHFCRCQDTAALMALGPVEAAGTFDNAYTYRARSDELTAGARAIIAAWTGPGTLVVVTHGSNIAPLVGSSQPPEGGIVVVAADRTKAGQLRVLGSIAPDR